MPVQNLLDLPLEILLLVFALLDGRQIARCRAVCVDFKKAVENSIALQYSVELAICGYADGHFTEETPAISATRLDQFRRHIDAWNKLEWVETRVTVPYGSLHAFSGGTYISLHNGVATCIQLPSYIRGLPLRTWTLHGISHDVFEIAVDPRRDLFVIIQPEEDEHNAITHAVLHLRVLSNNIPHPGALNPTIPFGLYPGRSWRTRFPCPIRIMQHLVGFVFNFDDATRLFIWDWTTGRRVVSLELGKDLPYRTFSFINTTSFMIPQTTELEVYQFSTDGSETPPIRTASFRLPDVLVDEEISCQIDTLYDLPSHDANGQEILLDGSLIPHGAFPFTIADDNHYIRLYRRTTRAIVTSSYVPLHVLRRCSMHENPFAIPYEAWAHGLSFHKTPRSLFYVLHNAHNGRFVKLVKRPPSPGLPPRVLLFDFNQNRARHRGVTTTGNPGVHEEPSPAEVVGMKYALADDWGSSHASDLVTTRPLDFDISDIASYPLCTDENIIFKRYLTVGSDGGDVEFIIKTMGAPYT